MKQKYLSLALILVLVSFSPDNKFAKVKTSLCTFCPQLTQYLHFRFHAKVLSFTFKDS